MGRRAEPHLHVAVRDAEEADDAAQLGTVSCRLSAAREFRFRHDLKQGHPSTIQVNEAVPHAALFAAAMHVLAGVLLQVRPARASPFQQLAMIAPLPVQ